MYKRIELKDNQLRELKDIGSKQLLIDVIKDYEAELKESFINCNNERSLEFKQRIIGIRLFCERLNKPKKYYSNIKENLNV